VELAERNRLEIYGIFPPFFAGKKVAPQANIAKQIKKTMVNLYAKADHSF